MIFTPSWPRGFFSPICDGPCWNAAIRRDVLLTIACAAATLLNPYGWRLHMHLIAYLRSDWIRQVVEEFQSPRFRSESMLQFEILLALGIAIVPALWRRRRLADGCLVLFWAHEALGSVRHVPIFCLIAAPMIAERLESLWSTWSAKQPARSWAGLFRQMDVEWRQGPAGFSLMPAAVSLAMLSVSGTALWTTEFPAVMFPSALVSRNFELLSTSGTAPARVFSSDQWSDFLIYRLHPHVLTFVDGRSDFFGPSRGGDYSPADGGPAGLRGHSGPRERVRFALLPSAWPLAGLLAADPQWTASRSRRPCKGSVPSRGFLRFSDGSADLRRTMNGASLSQARLIVFAAAWPFPFRR